MTVWIWWRQWHWIFKLYKLSVFVVGSPSAAVSSCVESLRTKKVNNSSWLWRGPPPVTLFVLRAIYHHQRGNWFAAWIHTHFTWKMQKASLWVRELLCVEGKQNNCVFGATEIFSIKYQRIDNWSECFDKQQTYPSKILFKQTFLILVLNFQSWVLPKDWTPTTVFTFHAHWVRLGNICSIICILYACLLAVL